MVKKVKITGYVTPLEQEMIRARAKELGMSIGVYLSEICIWERKLDLLSLVRTDEIKGLE